MATAFVTGGAGYVCSHCCKAFAAQGWEVAADFLRRKGGVHQVNLGAGRGTSVLDVLGRVESLTGRKIHAVQGPRLQATRQSCSPRPNGPAPPGEDLSGSSRDGRA